MIGLTGLIPVAGVSQGPTDVRMTVTNDVSVDWGWGTQFMITAISAGNGRVSGDTNGWYDVGTNVQVIAEPASYYHFLQWTGDVPSGSETSAVLSLNVDEPRVVTALFAENLATNSTPQWWLAAHGLTNRDWDVEALDDQDHDGMPTWQEWLCDTDPTDSNSVLKVTSLEPDAGGMRVFWEGGTGAWQYLERRENLGMTDELWAVIFSNLPPTTLSTNLLDIDGTNETLYYRIRAGR